MKNKQRYVMNMITIILYVIVSIIVLIVYTIKGDLSEVYEAFIPLAITAIACIIFNKNNHVEEEETKES